MGKARLIRILKRVGLALVLLYALANIFRGLLQG